MQNTPMPNTASALRGWAIRPSTQGDAAGDRGDRHGPVQRHADRARGSAPPATGSVDRRDVGDAAGCGRARRAAAPVICTGRVALADQPGVGVGDDLAHQLGALACVLGVAGRPGRATSVGRDRPAWRRWPSATTVAIWLRMPASRSTTSASSPLRRGVERDALQPPAAGGQGEAARRRRRRASPARPRRTVASLADADARSVCDRGVQPIDRCVRPSLATMLWRGARRRCAWCGGRRAFFTGLVRQAGHAAGRAASRGAGATRASSSGR